MISGLGLGSGGASRVSALYVRTSWYRPGICGLPAGIRRWRMCTEPAAGEDGHDEASHADGAAAHCCVDGGWLADVNRPAGDQVDECAVSQYQPWRHERLAVIGVKHHYRHIPVRLTGHAPPPARHGPRVGAAD